MSDAVILDEAVRLVDDGVSVTLPVNGRSMLPFIIGGEESVILQKPEAVAVGDVVLAWVEGCRWVVHRIIRIDGNRVTLMGDGNIVGTEHCTIADVKARVTYVVDAQGTPHDIYNRWRRLGARIWYRLRPVRRYVLYIYRKVKG
ncbi:MAG: hypothetical protein E7107_10800 [Prevotella sp.]|nr:hypothetical protein [Prevotella sp.]